MKRRLLFILSLLLPTLLMANPVGKEQAQEKALSFLNGRSAAKARGPKAASNLRLVMSQDCYHVFNIGTGDGFVIVSGDDCAPDILGYADSGTIDPQSMPDNMKAWLQGYADEINWMKQNGITAPKTRAATRGAIKANIAPLIQTHWNQYAPYNNYCPEYATGYKSVTGCVATAMAQVMYYHKWPTAATTAIPKYTWQSTDDMAELPAVTFDWGNMETTYSGSDEELAASTAANNSVATLMQYCGQSVEMDYGSSSGASTGDVADALKNYFNYNATTQYAVRSYYSYGDWINLIYHELSQNRPVLYDGSKRAGGGHAFVVHGYEYEDYFYVNWGWGGMSDGYFKLSAMDPDAEGAGGSSSAGGYCVGQGAVIGIQKPSDSGSVLSVTSFNINNLLIKEIKFDKESATVGETVQVTLSVKNIDAKEYDGDLYLIDTNGHGILDIKGFQIPGETTKDCVLSFSPEEAGTYTIMGCFPSASGGYSWYTGIPTKDITVTAGGGGGGGTVTSAVNLSRTINVENCLDGDNNFYGPGSQNTIKATITISNPETDKTYKGTYQIDLYDSSSHLLARNGSVITVPANSSIDVPFEVSGLANNADYRISTVYVNGTDSWSEWQHAYYTAKPAVVCYSGDGTMSLTKPSSSFAVPASSVAVNLTGLGVTSVTKNSQPNCLYILGTSDAVPSGLTNVIIYDGSANYTATTITLTDGNDFYSPVEFNATNIEFTYNNSIAADGTNGWNTLILPFNAVQATADGTDILWFIDGSSPGDFWVKEFVGDTNTGSNKVTFNYAHYIQANTPYIVAFPGDHWGASYDLSGKTIKFIGSGLVAKSEDIKPITGSYYRFVGSTHAVSTENIYCLNAAGNKFELKSSGGSGAFRAFFKPDTFDRTVTSLAIGGYEDPTGIDSIINSEAQEDGIYYNLKGQRVANPTKGLYILNGKKVVIK